MDTNETKSVSVSNGFYEGKHYTNFGSNLENYDFSVICFTIYLRLRCISFVIIVIKLLYSYIKSRLNVARIFLVCNEIEILELELLPIDGKFQNDFL